MISSITGVPVTCLSAARSVSLTIDLDRLPVMPWSDGKNTYDMKHLMKNQYLNDGDVFIFTDQRAER